MTIEQRDDNRLEVTLFYRSNRYRGNLARQFQDYTTKGPYIEKKLRLDICNQCILQLRNHTFDTMKPI